MALMTGPWLLSDLKAGKIGDKKNGLKVFSCFHCGGGSSMGYKLAGFEVLGGVEIDPQMMSIYRENFNPKKELSFEMPIQDFCGLDKDSLPNELFGVDVLDGSPPCSSFSVTGNREKDWGKSKKFREGQSEQVLDDLFFHFIKVADMLRPKVVVSENVKGLTMGTARGYVKEIFDKFSKAGYETQLFQLDAQFMGVPQSRNRVFFISRRRDLGLPKITLDFSESKVTLRTALRGLPEVVDNKKTKLTPLFLNYWKRTIPGRGLGDIGHFNSRCRLSWDKRAECATATHRNFHPSQPRLLDDLECVRIQTFPDDYNFLNADVGYVCGMSVPPFMMQRVASEVARLLSSNSPRRRPKASRP